MVIRHPFSIQDEDKSRIWTKISKFWTETSIVLLTITRSLLLPIVLILIILPVHLWRQIVSWLSKFLRPDLIKMVVTRSSLMAVDDWTNAPRCNLVVSIAFAGQLDMDELRIELEEKLISAKDANGHTTCPELSQYFTPWLGFLFWKNEDNFCIKSHVKYYPQNKRINSVELTRIENELCRRPFEAGRSAWEVYCIQDYESNSSSVDRSTHKCAVIFRIHHGIADGYSLLNLLLKQICQLHDHEYAQPKYLERTFLQKSMDTLRFILKSQYERVRQEVECNDRNVWRIPLSEISPIWYQVRSAEISLVQLKSIKDGYGVSFTAMLIGGLSGGIRKYMIKKGLQPPNVIHCLAPFPVPGHTTKLRNYYSYSFLRFPIGIEEPKRRMEFAERHLKSIKSSTTPRMNFMEGPLIGGLCTGMIRSLYKNKMSTGLMSNFPGPTDKCSFKGLPVLEIGFNGGLLQGNQGVGFAIISYQGFLTVRTSGCRSIFPEEKDVQELTKEIEAEFQLLFDSINV